MKSNNKKKWLVTAAALAAVAAMAGTFAWFTSTDKAKNEFEGAIAGNDIEIVEDFEKPDIWEPGTEVNKDVAVKNSGQYKSLIRVDLVEQITKLKDVNGLYTTTGTEIGASDYVMPLGMKKTDIETKFPDVSTYNGTAPSITINGKTYNLVVREHATAVNGGTKYEYLSYWSNGVDGEELYAKTGGLIRKDGKVVAKEEPKAKYIKIDYAAPTQGDWKNPIHIPTTPATPGKPSGPITGDGSGSIVLKGAADDKVEIKFVNLSAQPVQGKWNYNTKDGRFYYIGIVNPQEQTAQLIDSVTLSGAADNKYSKVKYELNVNAKGIQANEAAVDSTDWLGEKGAGSVNADISKALKGLAGITKN